MLPSSRILSAWRNWPDHGDEPFGAFIMNDEVIESSARNRRIGYSDWMVHAECFLHSDGSYAKKAISHTAYALNCISQFKIQEISRGTTKSSASDLLPGKPSKNENYRTVNGDGRNTYFYSTS